MSDDSQILQPDAMFGQHRVERFLGRGGMGEVYEMEHELTGKRHALKLLSHEVMEVPGALERFEREAKVMARLEHSGIVRVDFAGEDERRHWLRMELMNGREVAGQRVVTLEDYLEAKGGRLPEAEVKALLDNFLDALGHAHGKGLVHRDLKPANVLFDGNEVKIADFGLVNAAGAEWMETQVRSTVLNPDEVDTLIDSSGAGSRSRALMGTYAYMSPEQKKGLPADARSDLYAVGLMAFRMLTGEEMPGLKLPSRIINGLNAAWDDWLIKCLETNPDDRFPTAPLMQDALDFQAVAPPIAVKSESDPEPGAPALEGSQGVGEAFAVPDLALEMLWCEPGSFEMGSPSSEEDREDDERQHAVTLTQGFWLGKHEVTQAQWESFMDTNPSEFKGANLPVEQVSWDDAASFCAKLTDRESGAGRLPGGYAYQLPTEAQWEYACRAGTKTAFSFGDSLSSKQANFDGNYPYGGGYKGGLYLEKTAPVGSYPANAWGFHDLHGNVWEWCHDWYGDYPSGSAQDPRGSADGSERVFRGGSWFNFAVNLRSAYRYGFEPVNRYSGLGFRPSLRLVE